MLSSFSKGWSPSTENRFEYGSLRGAKLQLRHKQDPQNHRLTASVGDASSWTRNKTELKLRLGQPCSNIWWREPLVVYGQPLNQEIRARYTKYSIP